MKPTNQSLPTQEKATLHDALHFMKMAELKKACAMLELPDTGKKGALIERIMTFLTTGNITQSKTIPPRSRAKNYSPQPLKPSALMLYGSYKNDLATRTFFKRLIGPHFHFTAFGVDWLEEHWLKGNPPTYQEYADYWVKETARRKKQKANPKDEWRFIKFVQETHDTDPDASRTAVMHAWKQKQKEQATFAFELLKKYKK